MYDARKRKAMCSNRLCSGKYSVFGLNLSPLSWGSERRGSCPGPGEPGMPPARAQLHTWTTAQPDQPEQAGQPEKGGATGNGTIGKRGHRGQCPESRGPGCPRYPRYPGSQGIAGAAPGKETWETDWQHRQGSQARCRFEGRDAPVVRAVARTSRKLPATLHGTVLTECSRDCRTAGTLVSIETGSGTEGHDARQQCRRQLLRSFGVETVSFLVPSPPVLFSLGKERVALFTMQSRHQGWCAGLLCGRRPTLCPPVSLVAYCALVLAGCVHCLDAWDCAGGFGRLRRLFGGFGGDVFATCAYLVQKSERWSLCPEAWGKEERQEGPCTGPWNGLPRFSLTGWIVCPELKRP